MEPVGGAIDADMLAITVAVCVTCDEDDIVGDSVGPDENEAALIITTSLASATGEPNVVIQLDGE